MQNYLSSCDPRNETAVAFLSSVLIVLLKSFLILALLVHRSYFVIVLGCSGKNFQVWMVNENEISSADLMRGSAISLVAAFSY